MNSIALNNLWTYLQGLSLTANNQRWLGERLIEASSATENKSSITHSRKHSRGLTDEELAKHLAQYAPLTDSDFPEITKEGYANYVKKQNGKLTKHNSPSTFKTNDSRHH